MFASTTRSSLRGPCLAVLFACLCLTLTACSDDDAPPPAATATSTSTPQPTSTATPTETPTPPPHEHDEIVFGSDEPDFGSLVMEFDGDHQHLDFDTCLGGEGDECIGGIAVYSSDSPGYEHTEVDIPTESLFKLEDGTTVTLVIVAIDEGLSLNKDGDVADAPGDALVLGTIPELEHTHVEYVATVPGGTVGWEKNVTVKLVAPDSDYTESLPLTIEFRAEHE